MGEERSPIALTPPVRIVWHAGSVGALAEPQVVALPPVWRLLLLGDGSTTRNLSLLTGEHICVDVIEMRDAEDDASGPEDLDLIAAPRVRRCVWLCTERGTHLGYATSWWTARHARDYLTDVALPIGVNLNRLHCAPHRDIRLVFLGHRQLDRLWLRRGMWNGQGAQLVMPKRPRR